MAEHNSSLVNLSIPESVTAPIVAAKIQEAVLAALGGSEKIIAGVIHQICNTKVDSNGKVSSYSSSSDKTWLDFHVSSLLQDEIRKALIEQISVGSEAIKNELVKQLATKKGQSKIAEALLGALDGSFVNSWNSKFEISFETKK